MDKNDEQIKKNMKTANLWVFVKWEPSSTESLKASRHYALWEKAIDNPEKLTREEKDWLAAKFIECGSMNIVKLGGWAMCFPTAKKYLVQDKYDMRSWRMYSAFNKTSLRKALYGACGQIAEYPEKGR